MWWRSKVHDELTSHGRAEIEPIFTRPRITPWQQHTAGKYKLQIIAHEAMLQRGLLPDFSPAVIAETNQITQAAVASDAAVRDLRSLLWASIDNDDSADLDQLSVA